MKKFKFLVSVTYQGEIEIEANDIDEAVEIFNSNDCNYAEDVVAENDKDINFDIMEE